MNRALEREFWYRIFASAIELLAMHFYSSELVATKVRIIVWGEHAKVSDTYKHTWSRMWEVSNNATLCQHISTVKTLYNGHSVKQLPTQVPCDIMAYIWTSDEQSPLYYRFMGIMAQRWPLE